MEGLNISATVASLLISIINIVVLFVLVRLLVYKPVQNFMSNRSERIQKKMDEAEALSKEAETSKEKSDDILRHADEIADQKKREGEIEADKRARQIIADAQARAEEIIRDARKKMEAEKKAYFESARGQIADIAIEIASRVLEREVSEADNQAIIEEYFNKVG